MEFTQESRGDKLWTPEDSLAQKHKNWVDANFPTEVRVSIALVVAGDVLTPFILKEVSWFVWNGVTFRAGWNILFIRWKSHWHQTLQSGFLQMR